jgi:hypothetical protein
MPATLEESRLSKEDYDSINRQVVEEGREQFSDEYLLEWLIDLNTNVDRMTKTLFLACRVAHSGAKDYRFWLRIWQLIADRLNSDVETADLVAWHLKMRGDDHVEDYMLENAAAQRERNKEYLTYAYYMVET